MNDITAPIRYRLDLSNTKARQIGVDMRVERSGNEPVDFIMPQLSPGSPTNSLNQPARINHISATNDAGLPVELRKVESGHWLADSATGGAVTLHYQIKADEFSHVRSYLSPKLSYINGPSALMFVQGRQQEPALIELTGMPSQQWKTSSTLESLPQQPQIFYASNYDEVADSNLLAGDFQQVSRRSGNTILQINQNGKAPWVGMKVNGATAEQSLDDLQQLYTTFISEFGEFPRQCRQDARALPAPLLAQDDKYVVTKHYIWGQGPNAGGFEHYHGHELLLHKAAQAGIERRFDGDGRAHERHIMAHELMHKLLAKFVRHQGIDSADLSRVGSSDGLWLSEGGVEWAALELQRKSGQMNQTQYIKMLQDLFRGYETAYALDPSNAPENSLDAHLGNSGFYNKGAVTCALLDLELKIATQGQHGMFDVFRQLKSEFGGQQRFWTLQDIERIALDIAGSGSERVVTFFQDYLIDHKPFSFEQMLAQVGMQWHRRDNCFPEGQLQLSGGKLLSSDTNALVSLQASQTPLQAGSISLPAFGLTLSQNEQGQLKLASVTAGGAAAQAGAAQAVGQPLQLLLVSEQQLLLEIQTSDPFTGETEQSQFDIAAQPVSQVFLEEIPQSDPDKVALRKAWLS